MAYKSVTPIGRMHEAYGCSSLDYCKKCCNYQKRERGGSDYICIAYSNTEPWKETWMACVDLYNYPFRAIRPRQKPLAETIGQKRKKKSDVCDGQAEISQAGKTRTGEVNR